MATKTPRINITVDEHFLSALDKAAKKRRQSLSSYAIDLMKLGWEVKEDWELSKIALARDVKGAKRVSYDAVRRKFLPD